MDSEVPVGEKKTGWEAYNYISECFKETKVLKELSFIQVHISNRPLSILKLSIIASLGGHKQSLFIFIHFLCLCPLKLAIMVNFNILKVAYWSSVKR